MFMLNADPARVANQVRAVAPSNPVAVASFAADRMKLKKTDFLFPRFLEPVWPLALAGRQFMPAVFLRLVQIALTSGRVLSKIGKP
jgi:hypothetical protein